MREICLVKRCHQPDFMIDLAYSQACGVHSVTVTYINNSNIYFKLNKLNKVYPFFFCPLPANTF